MVDLALVTALVVQERHGHQVRAVNLAVAQAAVLHDLVLDLAAAVQVHGVRRRAVVLLHFAAVGDEEQVDAAVHLAPLLGGSLLHERLGVLRALQVAGAVHAPAAGMLGDAVFAAHELHRREAVEIQRKELGEPLESSGHGIPSGIESAPHGARAFIRPL